MLPRTINTTRRALDHKQTTAAARTRARAQDDIAEANIRARELLAAAGTKRTDDSDLADSRVWRLAIPRSHLATIQKRARGCYLVTLYDETTGRPVHEALPSERAARAFCMNYFDTALELGSLRNIEWVRCVDAHDREQIATFADTTYMFANQYARYDRN